MHTYTPIDRLNEKNRKQCEIKVTKSTSQNAHTNMYIIRTDVYKHHIHDTTSTQSR